MRGRLDGSEEATDPEDQLNISEVMSYSPERFTAVRARPNRTKTL